MPQSESEYSTSKQRQTLFKRVAIVAALVAIAFLVAFILVLVLYLNDKAAVR